LEQYISKFLDLDAAGTGSNINLIILRYADLLLMKAEADGESAASYELINQVRRRAFGKIQG
jgi:starch-binding outer membrane protein, SusD/RagB family